MKLLLSLALATLATLDVAGKRAPPSSLRIGVKHRPQECPIESQADDMLVM